MSKVFLVLLLFLPLNLASGNNNAWTSINKEKKKLDRRSLAAPSNTTGKSPGFTGGLFSLPKIIVDSSSTSDVVFCVANSDADPEALRNGLNWACGPGSANCSAIQPGQPCYQEGNLVAMASFAYNDYYQKEKASGGTCNFSNTAVLTTTDPSHGSCIFTGSTAAGTNTSIGGGSPGGRPLQFVGAGYLFSVTVLHVWMYL